MNGSIYQALNRRKFLWLGGGGIVSLTVSSITTGYYASRIEPQHLVLEHRTIHLPYFSAALDTLRVARMSDHHLFPFTPRELLEHAVEQANS